MLSFDDLLAPYSRPEFLQNYWGKKPLLIQGNADRFQELPGIENLPAILSGTLSAAHWMKGYGGTAQASLLGKDGEVKTLNAPSSMWSDLYNSGFSLCFAPINGFHRSLQDLIKNIEMTTPYSGNNCITCYLTPAFAGSSMHFDSQNVLLLQMSGEKRWRFGSKVGWQDPPINLTADALHSPLVKGLIDDLGADVSGPEQSEMTEVVITAGDVLYLPPGFWHEGHTLDQPSFHYTLTFLPFTAWNIVLPLLRKVASENSSFNKDLRFAEAGSGPSREELVKFALDALRDQLNGLSSDAACQGYASLLLREGLLSRGLLRA